MASGRRTHGIVVLFGWCIVALMAIFYVVVGQEWYKNGYLRLCLPEDTLEFPYGHYRPPANPDDIKKPAYWCKLAEMRAEQSTNSNSNASKCETLLQGTEFCKDSLTPAGMDQFWGDDVISNFFRNGFLLIYRWSSEILSPWFELDVVPAWNGFFAADDSTAEAHRTALAYVAAAVFVAFLGAVAIKTFDWLTIWRYG
jgi:hypothetical protein